MPLPMRWPVLGSAVLIVGVLGTSAGMAAAGSNPSPAPAASSISSGNAVPGRDGTVQTTPLLGARAALVIDRAAGVREALGFPAGAAREARHVVDAARAEEYDALTELDPAGSPLSELRFDRAGRLALAVRLDRAAGRDTALTAAGASRAARRALAAVEFAPAGNETVTADTWQGGWQVQWARTQRGVAVRGDETRVHVRADGSIGSVARVEHDLAPEPERRMAGQAALRVVAREADNWFDGTNSGYRLGGAVLEWVEPNGLFDATIPMNGAGPCRLAWVVDLEPTGAAALSVRLITVFVDAGTGALLGGDVVQ